MSNRLEAGYDGTVSPGGPLSLYCRSPSAEWTSCRWTDPAGAEYEVLTGREDFVDGALTDELTCAIATDALTVNLVAFQKLVAYRGYFVAVGLFTLCGRFIRSSKVEFTQVVFF